MNHPRPFRILAIALTTRGFGYVVMEGQNTLIEYGGTVVNGDKNAKCIAKAKKLMDFYQPDVLVLQDVEAKGSRRAPRIKILHRQIVELAGKRKLKVTTFSKSQLLKLLLGDEKGTKHDMAQKLANDFPDELASRLPPKRKAWKSQDGRMDVFDALALAVAFWLKK